MSDYKRKADAWFARNGITEQGACEFSFDRYANGTKLQSGVVITREDNLEDAIRSATVLADKSSSYERQVLVLRQNDSISEIVEVAKAEERQRIREALLSTPAIDAHIAGSRHLRADEFAGEYDAVEAGLKAQLQHIGITEDEAAIEAMKAD